MVLHRLLDALLEGATALNRMLKIAGLAMMTKRYDFQSHGDK